MRARHAAAFALLALALPVAAQEDCTQPLNPCPWTVGVDATGIFASSLQTVTQDEWYELTVDNTDEAPHTVTLEDHGVEIVVPADDSRSAVVQFTRTGTFRLRDAPSGTSVVIDVVADDAIEHERGTATSGGAATSTGAPGPALALLLAAIAVMAAVRRRS